jgi:DNA-binding response OmpR family regulator
MSNAKQPNALVLSDDPLAAALVAAAIEHHGLTPAFPRAGESPRDALRRLRPSVVLVDCQHGTACSESFLGPALMTGARIIVFGAARLERDVRAIAAKHRLDYLVLPSAPDALARLLRGGG